MKIGIKLILIGLLSLLVGSAFASPLLVVELDEIRPYTEPLPKGPTADISASVVYANFSVGDTMLHEGYNRNVTELNYFVVLNITNNSDDWAVVSHVNFDAARNITKDVSSDSPLCGENWTGFSEWVAEGAWVDGIWYNLTWVPHDNFAINCSSLIFGQDMWGDELQITGEGYWMEGVQIVDKRVGGVVTGNLTNTYMNMNGTWIDVTGRINVTRMEEPDLSYLVTVSEVLFSEMKTLIPGSVSGMDDWVLDNIVTNVDSGFNYCWAPHQSRLIAIANNRKILTEILESAKIELLETEPIDFRVRVDHRLNGTLGIYDSSSFSEEIKPVHMELTEDGYLYNTILSDDQMFVMDSYGAEVFIEPRD